MQQTLPDLDVRVSVPLPGFSGLRLAASSGTLESSKSFSPVAGIQWVETPAYPPYWDFEHCQFQSRCRDSVG